jgi:hypothetical protein
MKRSIPSVGGSFDILHQVPGGVRLDAGMRARPAAAALVEQDDAVMPGSK